MPLFLKSMINKDLKPKTNGCKFCWTAGMGKQIDFAASVAKLLRKIMSVTKLRSSGVITALVTDI